MIALRVKTGKVMARRMALLAATGALALGAAGCREDEQAARIAVPDPTPAALLPEPMALPYAEAAPIGWTEPYAGYRYAERAYGLEQAFYDAPPDYAFDYGGVEPWVWETSDDWSMYAEPWETGYRYYYYEPGAAYPYFVRDGLYGYGFDPTGALIALIDSDGDYLPADRFVDAAPLAGRYYLHGRDLRNAAAQGRRVRVQETAWIQRAPQVRRASEPWLQAARSDGDWRAWREKAGRDKAGKRELKRFEQEARRRERDAEAWRRDARRIAAQQAALPVARADPRLNGPEVQARRDMALAQREQLRAQRDEARDQARERARERGRQQAEAERRFAERQRNAQQQARQEARQQARAAEDHARHAAAQAQAQAQRRERGPRAGNDGGGGDRGFKPDRGGGGQDRGPKPDRGGEKGGGGKGGGKKD